MTDPGLPPEIADDVFEPFISGRENGTGLGLGAWFKTDRGRRRMDFRR